MVTTFPCWIATERCWSRYWRANSFPVATIILRARYLRKAWDSGPITPSVSTVIGAKEWLLLWLTYFCLLDCSALAVTVPSHTHSLLHDQAAWRNCLRSVSLSKALQWLERLYHLHTLTALLIVVTSTSQGDCGCHSTWAGLPIVIPSRTHSLVHCQAVWRNGLCNCCEQQLFGQNNWPRSLQVACNASPISRGDHWCNTPSAMSSTNAIPAGHLPCSPNSVEILSAVPMSEPLVGYFACSAAFVGTFTCSVALAGHLPCTAIHSVCTSLSWFTLHAVLVAPMS